MARLLFAGAREMARLLFAGAREMGGLLPARLEQCCSFCWRV